MFSNAMLGNLMKGCRTLRQEMLANLAASPDPIRSQDLFDKSEVADNSRDVTLEMSKLKTLGLVLRVEPPARVKDQASAYWVITDKGRNYILKNIGADDTDDIDAADNTPDEESGAVRTTVELAKIEATPATAVESLHQPVTKPLAPKPTIIPGARARPDGKAYSADIITAVQEQPGIQRRELVALFLLPDESNFKRVKDMISYMVSSGSLRAERDPHDKTKTSMYLGQKIIEKGKFPRAKAKPKAKAKGWKKTAGSQTKPKVVQILEFIEKTPGSSYADISSGTGHAYADAYLNSYLRNGQVVRWIDAEKVKRYRLADGMTAAAILAGKGCKAVPAAPGTEHPAQQPAAAEIPPVAAFRAAYTSEGTLILFGITPEPIELSQPATEKLSNFISNRVKVTS